MKCRRIMWMGLALVLLAVAGLAVAFLDPDARLRGWVAGEPFFRGRAATAWRHDLRQPDEAAAVAARDALTAGKGDAVPVCAWLVARAPEAPPPARDRVSR